jgi:hypothetical protein
VDPICKTKNLPLRTPFLPRDDFGGHLLVPRLHELDVDLMLSSTGPSEVGVQVRGWTILDNDEFPENLRESAKSADNSLRGGRTWLYPAGAFSLEGSFLGGGCRII